MTLLRARLPLTAIAAGLLGLMVGGCTTTPDGSPRTSEATTATPTASAPSTPPLTPSPTPTATPTPTPTPTPMSARPVITPIGNPQWARMERTGTWRPECPVGREDLRRLDVNHIGFDGNIDRGSLVAHRDSIDDLAVIFTELFDAGFPIERMQPVETYDGDVVRSLEANNTSAFNCRRPDQINAPVADSPHANGRAIDINRTRTPGPIHGAIAGCRRMTSRRCGSARA